ncbi:MAG: DUF3999 domain-containing protein [Thermoanaerobaculales bacterium]|jgi:hypothetical protein|nr:DUF3999 domain-containing protein [Thermoanaerobaculales bacterium]
MRGTIALVGFAALVLALPVAAETESLTALFPLRAPIVADGAGLQRLELPAAVIGACRADLADLRIVAADGREIPYLVDGPEPQGVATGVRFGAAPEVLEAERSREAVGDRVTVYHERYLLAVPPAPADVPAWELVLEVAREEFVGRLDATAIGPDGVRTPVVTRGSVFRLPAAAAERLRLTLPTRDAIRLEIALASEEGGFLEPGFALAASRTLPESGGPSSVALEILELRQLPGSTELVIDRPRGLVPRRLALTTSTGTFHRTVTVWDEGPGAEEEPLGRGTVLRVAALAPVEVLELPLRAPRGDRLRLVVDNLDSPPLEEIGVAATLPRPVLVFSMPEGETSATLLFGGGRAHRPSYDLAALDPERRLPTTGEAARQVLAVVDPAQARPAALGEVMANPEWDPAPVLAFAMHPGAPVEVRRYEHRRRLAVAPSPEGLSRVRLSPADLAILRPDLADLRVVDADGRQWAYLRQDRARVVTSKLTASSHRRDGRVSLYRIGAGGGPMTVDELELASGASYFDRDFTLRGRLEDGSERELARGRLVRRAGDPRPVSIGLAGHRITELTLEIADGDDAPLVFDGVEARSTAPDLYLAAPAGDYELLLGDPEAAAPVYELERVRSAILAVPAGDAEIGELEANPGFRAASRLAGGGTWQKALLWTVLGLAVVVLAVLTLRAAKG